jgi:hypothetical protein
MNGSTVETFEESAPPSVAAANHFTRVLSGKPLKYTVRIFSADSRIVEFQSGATPKLKFEAEDQHLWIETDGYPDNYPVCRYEPGMFITCEKNPL